jgi:Ca-activated chloride channel family protein
MFGLSFSHAAYLGLLFVLVPLVVAVWYGSTKAAIHAREAWSERRLLDRFTRPLTLRSQLPALICWTLAVILLVVSAAGPSLPEAPRTAKAGSVEVVVAVDVSRSQGVEDYKGDIPQSYLDKFYLAHGNRLDETKYVIETQIMAAIAGNQLGLVTYKGDGFEQAPLTDDFGSLEFVIDNWLQIGNAPGGGSDYARGLQTAIDMFKNNAKDNPDAQRVIVLFSDGGFTGDQQMLAAVLKELKDNNIRLVVLGLGYKNNMPVPQYDPTTGQFLGNYKYNDGKTANDTNIDENALRALASAAGGQYYHVDGGDLGINWPTALQGRDKVENESRDVYQYTLGLALLLIVALALMGLLEDTRRGKALLYALRAPGLTRQQRLEIISEQVHHLPDRLVKGRVANKIARKRRGLLRRHTKE